MDVMMKGNSQTCCPDTKINFYPQSLRLSGGHVEYITQYLKTLYLVAVIKTSRLWVGLSPASTL
jgi:hypothetical protein